MPSEDVNVTFAWSIDTTHFQGQQSMKLQRSHYEQNVTPEDADPGSSDFGQEPELVIEENQGDPLNMVTQCSVCVHPAPPEPDTCDTLWKPDGFEGEPYTIKTSGTMSAPDVSALYAKLADDCAIRITGPDVRFDFTAYTRTHDGDPVTFGGDLAAMTYEINSQVVGIGNWTHGGDIVSYGKSREGVPNYFMPEDWLVSADVYTTFDAKFQYNLNHEVGDRWVDKLELGMNPGDEVNLGPTGNLIAGMNLNLEMDKRFLDQGPCHVAESELSCRVNVSRIQHAATSSRNVGSIQSGHVMTMLDDFPVAQGVSTNDLRMAGLPLDTFRVHKITTLMGTTTRTGKRAWAYSGNRIFPRITLGPVGYWAYKQAKGEATHPDAFNWRVTSAANWSSTNNAPPPGGDYENAFPKSGPDFTQTSPGGDVEQFMNMDDYGLGFDSHTSKWIEDTLRIDQESEFAQNVLNHLGSSIDLAFFPPGFTPWNWQYYVSGIGYFWRYNTTGYPPGNGEFAPSKMVLRVPAAETTQQMLETVSARNWRVYEASPGNWVLEQPYPVATYVNKEADWLEEQRYYQVENDLCQYAVEFYNSVLGPYENNIELITETDAYGGQTAEWRFKTGYTANFLNALQNSGLCDIKVHPVGNPAGQKTWYYRAPIAEVRQAVFNRSTWVAPGGQYARDFKNAPLEYTGGADGTPLLSEVPAVNKSNWAYMGNPFGTSPVNGYYGSDRIDRDTIIAAAGLDSPEDFSIGIGGNTSADFYGNDFTTTGQKSVQVGFNPRVYADELSFGNSSYPSTTGPNEGGGDNSISGLKLREVAWAEAIWSDIGGRDVGGTVFDGDDPNEGPEPAGSQNVSTFRSVSGDTWCPQVEGRWTHTVNITSARMYEPLFHSYNDTHLEGYPTERPSLDGQPVSSLNSKYHTWKWILDDDFNGFPLNYSTSQAALESAVSSFLEGNPNAYAVGPSGDYILGGTCKTAFIEYDVPEMAIMFHDGTSQTWSGFYDAENTNVELPNMRDLHAVLDGDGVLTDMQGCPAKREDGGPIALNVLTGYGIDIGDHTNIVDWLKEKSEYLDYDADNGYKTVYYPEVLESSKGLHDQKDLVYNEQQKLNNIRQDYQAKYLNAETNRDTFLDAVATAEAELAEAETQEEIDYWTEQRDLAQAAANVWDAKYNKWYAKYQEYDALYDAKGAELVAVNAQLTELEDKHTAARQLVRDFSEFTGTGASEWFDQNMLNYMRQYDEMVHAGWTDEEIRSAHPCAYLNGAPQYEGKLVHLAFLIGCLLNEGVVDTLRTKYAILWSSSDAAAAAELIDWDDIQNFHPMTRQVPGTVGGGVEKALEVRKAFAVNHDGWVDMNESMDSFTDPSSISSIELEGIPVGLEDIAWWGRSNTWQPWDGTNVYSDGGVSPRWFYVCVPFLDPLGLSGFTYETTNMKNEQVPVCAEGYAIVDAQKSSVAPSVSPGKMGFAWAGDRGLQNWPDFNNGANPVHAGVADTQFWAEAGVESGDCVFKRVLGDAQNKQPPGGSVKPGADDKLTWSIPVEQYSPTSTMQMYMDTKSSKIQFGENKRVTVELLEEEGQTFTEEERAQMEQDLENNPVFRNPVFKVFEDQQCHISVNPVDPEEVQQFFYEEPKPGEPETTVYTYPLYVLESQAQKQDLSFGGVGQATTVVIDEVDWFLPSTMHVPGDPEADPPVPDDPGSYFQDETAPEDTLILPTFEALT